MLLFSRCLSLSPSARLLFKPANIDSPQMRWEEPSFTRSRQFYEALAVAICSDHSNVVKPPSPPPTTLSASSLILSWPLSQIKKKRKRERNYERVHFLLLSRQIGSNFAATPPLSFTPTYAASSGREVLITEAAAGSLLRNIEARVNWRPRIWCEPCYRAYFGQEMLIIHRF